MPNFVLSPIGTSLLTNSTQMKEERSLLNRHANKIEKEVPDEVKYLIDEIENKLFKELPEASHPELKKAGAELNSLLRLYDNNFKGNRQDVHFLIATDTYQGKVAADLLQGYLRKFMNTVEVIKPDGFSTKNMQSFRSGIRYLLKWCDENLENYKQSGYEVIFNLTGGFKSLQGYLNTIGMFYADKIIYIFEGSDELITIPRLPIEINARLFHEKTGLFLQLSQTNEGIREESLEDVSQTFVEEYEDGKYILSDWGELSWNKAKKDILKRMLIPLPCLKYTDSFQKDFQNTKNPIAKIKLQETLAFISCQLQANKGDVGILKGGRSGGVLYDNYTNKNSHLGHFRIGKGPRVSCEAKNGILELRHYGEHDYVNNNP